ncbi:MAG: 2-deoxy-D-gluconate 3-dehydrogenase, partial [Sulfobacillus thermosulfidooxidans]
MSRDFLHHRAIWKDKIAIVTGAGRGIGLQTALMLSRLGVTIAAVGRQPLPLTTLVERIQNEGGQAISIPCDLQNVSDIQNMVTLVYTTFGRIDILINNAGIDIPQPALDVSERNWTTIIDTNLKGMFFCAQHVGRYMVSQGGGTIVNMASELSYVGAPGYVAYSISKAGVAQMTRSLAAEWAPFHIRVNALAP